MHREIKSLIGKIVKNQKNIVGEERSFQEKMTEIEQVFVDVFGKVNFFQNIQDHEQMLGNFQADLGSLIVITSRKIMEGEDLFSKLTQLVSAYRHMFPEKLMGVLGKMIY